jgi:hypothetical protein
MGFIYASLIVLGFIPFLIILYKMNRVKRMKRTGVKTVGTIRELSGSSLKGLNSLVIEYSIEGSNEVVQKQISVAGMPYRVGDQLPLYYDRNDPNKMLFDSGKSFIILLVFTLLLAVFFIAACFMIHQSIAAGEM